MAGVKDESTQDLESSIADLLKRATRIAHLHHIFSGEKRALREYYGKSKRGYSHKHRHAKAIARDFEEPTREFLHRLENDFRPQKRNQTALDDILLDHDLTADQIEAFDPTYAEYLLILYHIFYDIEVEDLPNYEYLSAKTTLFPKSTNTSFYNSRVFTIQKQFLKRKCQETTRTLSRSGRNFYANLLYANEDEEAVIKFYWERTRNPEIIFKKRREGYGSPTDGVTHRPAYPVKTITLKISNGDDSSTIFFNKSPSNWRRKLRSFFDITFSMPQPFKSFEQKKNSKVDQVIDSMVGAAEKVDDDGAGQIFEAVNDELESLWNQSVEDVRVENEEKAKALEDRYSSIRPYGLHISQDDDTLSQEFSIKSKGSLEEWVKKNPGGARVIVHELKTAKRENIGIRFRGRLREDGSTDEFVFRDGSWENEPGQGLHQEAEELLDQLLNDDE